MNDNNVPSPADRFANIDQTRAERATERAAAMATPCAFDGCSGTGHDNASWDPAQWRHEVVDESFDGGIVTADISLFSDGSPLEASIHFDGDGIMTAAEFRAAADDYESFPAWLRSLADRMDALAV